MTTRTLLGIDLGTSSVKVLLVTLGGTVLAEASAEYPILQPHPQHAQQDPDAWWRATAAAVRQATAAHEARAIANHEIAAIGLSGQMHGVVMLDAAGHLLAPAVIWPDGRSSRQVQEITALVGAERLYSITGSPLSTGFLAATARWFQQEAPALWGRAATLLLPKDYLRWRMTGLPATDASDAAGSLLLDERTRAWSAELLDLLEIDPALLPPSNLRPRSPVRSCPVPPPTWGCPPVSPSSPGPPIQPAARWGPAPSPPTGSCSASAPAASWSSRWRASASTAAGASTPFAAPSNLATAAPPGTRWGPRSAPAWPCAGSAIISWAGGVPTPMSA